MAELSIGEMLEMQKVFQSKHPEWPDLTPEYGRTTLLWMLEEFGEVVSVIKKRGEKAIMKNPEIRAQFVEECGDVVMFMMDALLCFDISAEEFEAAYRQKMARNMQRDWTKTDSKYHEDK